MEGDFFDKYHSTMVERTNSIMFRRTLLRIPESELGFNDPPENTSNH
jgi:hypothetical protein